MDKIYYSPDISNSRFFKSPSEEEKSTQVEIIRKWCDDFISTVKFDETLEPLKKEDCNITKSYDLWKYINIKTLESFKNSSDQKDKVIKTYLDESHPYLDMFGVSGVINRLWTHRTEVSKEYQSCIAGYALGSFGMLNRKLFTTKEWKFMDENLLKSFLLANAGKFYLYKIIDCIEDSTKKSSILLEGFII